MFFMISDRDIKKIKKELAKDFVTKQEFKRGIESSNNYTEKLFISYFLLLNSNLPFLDSPN